MIFYLAEPGQVASSPPFPRYSGYNEVATGTSGHDAFSNSDSGLQKVKTLVRDMSSALALRPKRSVPYPSRYPPVTGVNKLRPGVTPDWITSELGQYYLNEHQIRAAPTQLLSFECQKRKFNPDFQAEVLNPQTFRCSVTVLDITVSCPGTYSDAQAARQDAAYKALRIVRKWAIPPPTCQLYYVAQFHGQISDDEIGRAHV